MKLRLLPVCALIGSLIGRCVPPVSAQPASPGQVWAYRLLQGSTFLDDCRICERLTMPLPMRGTFDLVLLEDTGTVTRYALSNISRSEEHTSELQSLTNLVCRLLLEKKKEYNKNTKRPTKTE